MDSEKTKELLKRYQEGKCTNEEKRIIDKWYKTQVKRNLNYQTDEELNELRTAGWDSISNELWSKSRKLPLSIKFDLRIASCVIGFLLIALLVIKRQGSTYEANSENQYVRVQTTQGTKRYLLPDSSVIILNAGSSIKYPKLFTDGVREVTLEEGEVFFDVRKDKKRPFIVHAGRTKTEVLGTAFSIRSYRALEDIQVLVARGRVSVQNSIESLQKEPAILLPDDQLVVSKKDGEFQQNKVNSAFLLGWTEGKVQIHNESLKFISVVLEKRFDVSIDYRENALKDLRFSTGFTQNDSLEDILENLSMAGNLQYTLINNTVVFSLKN